jgi:hypothetical protein
MTTENTGGRAEDALLSLLDEMRAVYGQLDALSQRQSELIDAENHEPLLTILEERQLLIDRLLGIKRRADPLRERWEAEGGGCEGSPVQESLRGIARIAAAIEERDALDRRAIEERRHMVAKELSELGRGRVAVSSYGGQERSAGPKFQDVEG